MRAAPLIPITRGAAMAACSPLADARDRKLALAAWTAWGAEDPLTAQIARNHAADAAMYESCRAEMAAAWLSPTTVRSTS